MLRLSRRRCSAFAADRAGLAAAVDALLHPPPFAPLNLPATLPEAGVGERAALDALAPAVIGGATRLGQPVAMAHMDPPTPWVTWATTLWNASLNQNLLHPDLAPVARVAEEQVVAWLAPSFGMGGGHVTPGSTVANLTALWAARELRGVKSVVASEAAHHSIPKAARILGLRYQAVPADPATGRMLLERCPSDLSEAALVLTAGTTSAGAIDDLSMASAGRAAWTRRGRARSGCQMLTRTDWREWSRQTQSRSRRTSGSGSPRRQAWCSFGEPERRTNR
eukprot:4235177-Prymnesium_polylepis.1